MVSTRTAPPSRSGSTSFGAAVNKPPVITISPSTSCTKSPTRPAQEEVEYDENSPSRFSKIPHGNSSPNAPQTDTSIRFKVRGGFRPTSSGGTPGWSSFNPLRGSRCFQTFRYNCPFLGGKSVSIRFEVRGAPRQDHTRVALCRIRFNPLRGSRCSQTIYELTFEPRGLPLVSIRFEVRGAPRLHRYP